MYHFQMENLNTSVTINCFLLRLITMLAFQYFIKRVSDLFSESFSPENALVYLANYLVNLKRNDNINSPFSFQSAGAESLSFEMRMSIPQDLAIFEHKVEPGISHHKYLR